MINGSRKIWQQDSFSWKKPEPSWPCPICGTGTLSKDGKSIVPYQTRDTVMARKSIKYHGKEDAKFRFAGYVKCNNGQCNEKVMISGPGELFAASTDRPVSSNYAGERYLVYHPEYFEPALEIITLPENTPEEIKKEMTKAFKLFWIDIPSCTNKIRTCLEILMTGKKIKRYYLTNSRKRRAFNLHQRIELFGERYPILSTHLIAVKWIGNAGSHGTGLTRDDAMDGFELLGFVLDELYGRPERQKKYNRVSSKINTTKKPLSKSSKK